MSGTVNVAFFLHEVNYHHKKVFWEIEDSTYYECRYQVKESGQTHVSFAWASVNHLRFSLDGRLVVEQSRSGSCG